MYNIHQGHFADSPFFLVQMAWRATPWILTQAWEARIPFLVLPCHRDCPSGSSAPANGMRQGTVKHIISFTLTSPTLGTQGHLKIWQCQWPLLHLVSQGLICCWRFSKSFATFRFLLNLEFLQPFLKFKVSAFPKVTQEAYGREESSTLHTLNSRSLNTQH